MKQKFNSDLGKIWSEVRAAYDKGDLMTYPDLIRRFIRCFSDFAAWVEESIPSRVVQAENALRILQKRRVDPSTFQNDRKEWLRIRDDFTRISHHDRNSNENDFWRLVDNLEILLLKYLRPIASEKLKAIEQITTSAGGAPTAAHLSDIKHLIDGWADRDAFLAAIQHPSWLSLLIEDGWFDPGSAEAPPANHHAPGYREAQLLARFVDSHPDEADRAARQLALIGNERVYLDILEIANRLPSASGTGLYRFRQTVGSSDQYIPHSETA